MRRGEIWWASLPSPSASEPGYRRPVLIIQSNTFNHTRLRTVACLAITSNLALRDMPGNVFIASGESGLSKDSVINVSQIVTVDRTYLTQKAGQVSADTMRRVNEGIRLALGV